MCRWSVFVGLLAVSFAAGSSALFPLRVKAQDGVPAEGYYETGTTAGSVFIEFRDRVTGILERIVERLDDLNQRSDELSSQAYDFSRCANSLAETRERIAELESHTYDISAAAAVVAAEKAAAAFDERYTLVRTNAQTIVYVAPHEPSAVLFPNEIRDGFKPKDSSLSIERNGNRLVLFAAPALTDPGESLLVTLVDGRLFSIRVRPEDESHPADRIMEIREGTPELR